MLNKNLFLSVAAVVLATASFSSQADFLFGVHGEVQYWHASNEGSFGLGSNQDESDWKSDGATRLSVSFNHFVPLIPNIMVERQMLETKGSMTHLNDYTIGNVVFPASSEASTGTIDSNWDLGHDSLTLYYRLLDNSLLELYFGVSAKKYSGDVTLSVNGQTAQYTLDEVIPMGYVRVTAGLPFTGLSFRAQGNPVSIGNHDSYDVEASLRYEFLDTLPLNGIVSAGYRMMSLKFDNASGLSNDFEMKGPFVNLSLHF